jgi:Ca2+-binding EF-hand superfamily protein
MRRLFSWRTRLAGWALCGAIAPSAALGADCDLILNGKQLPARVSVAVVINDRPLSAAWDENFASLVDFFDRDGDTHLSPVEAANLPSVQAMREVLGAGFTPSLGTPLAFGDLDANADGQVDVAELAAYYRAAGIGRPIVGAGLLPQTAAMNAALTAMLDANGDQQLDAAELKAAPKVIERFDRNDDEMVGAGELIAGLRYPGASGSNLLRAAPQSAGAAAGTDTTRTNPTGAIRLGDSELAARSENAHPFALSFTLEPRTEDSDQESADDSPDLHVPVVKAADPAAANFAAGSLNFVRPGIQLVVRTDAGRLAETAGAYYQRLRSQFSSDDLNSDETLDRDEREKANEREWQAMLPALDRNADAQISLAELNAWLHLQRQLAESQLLLTLLDAGQGLFELLDASHDGALSAAELRVAADTLSTAGALQKGKVDMSRLPQLFLLTASQGYPHSVLGSVERTGPTWFLAMDRNRDGEISQREFTGPAAAFTRLDADGDQRVSLIEAELPAAK